MSAIKNRPAFQDFALEVRRGGFEALDVEERLILVDLQPHGRLFFNRRPGSPDGALIPAPAGVDERMRLAGFGPRSAASYPSGRLSALRPGFGPVRRAPWLAYRRWHLGSATPVPEVRSVLRQPAGDIAEARPAYGKHSGPTAHIPRGWCLLVLPHNELVHAP